MTRILLVDDDPDILDIIKLELEDDPSCSVDACNSAKDALQKASLTSYDIIISDLLMPGMDGTSLVRELRSRGITSIIVIYSGHDMGAGIRKALDSGADHYLARSGDPETEFAEMRTIIRKAMSKKAGESAQLT